jgi:hypothetical protein
MAKTLVYRIETSDGTGPYRSMATWVELTKLAPNLSQTCTERHPTPRSDGINLWDEPDGEEYRFGFASLDQRDQWFTDPEQVALMTLGFVTTVYEVDSSYILFGESQLTFHKKKAVVVLQ